MPIDLNALLSQNRGRARELFSEYMNPVFSNVLEMIGFQHEYTHGEGCYITGADGGRYYDSLSGYGVFAMGRNHPAIRDAMRQALDLNLPNLVQMDNFLPAALLAEKLISIAPGGLRHVFFTNSGAEAVEGAVKFARAATGRPRILYQSHAFHGLTTGALALNGDESFREGFGNLLPGAAKINFDDLAAVEAELRREDVAALMLEPIRGKGVLYNQDDTAYPNLQRLCHKYGALLICDEIQAGLGRTGKWWSCQHWNLEPDIITCAKALSGGYVPVGAILYTRDVYAKVFSRLDRCVVHSSTFGQNAMAMVAGLAALQWMQDENIPERAARLGERLMRGLKALQDKHEFIADVRGKGLMAGIEFGSPKSLMLKPAWALLHAAENGLFAQAVVMRLFQDWKILSQVSGHHQEIIKWIPPLITTEDELDRLVEALDDVMGQCKTFPGPVWSVGKQLASAAAKQHFAKRAKSTA